MPLTALTELLRQARSAGYAVGYFEAWDGYSLEAVLDAAQTERSPVILGFGCKMVDTGWLDAGGIERWGAYGNCVARRARVPVALLLNEAQSRAQAARALEAGFNAVMLDTAELPPERALEDVALLVRAARPRGIAVEAEVGRLPDAGPGGAVVAPGRLTEPEEARAFVAATGVDALAVSVGNVHLLASGAASIDSVRLGRIRRAVDVPLVIHGGTGFPPERVPEAIASGVAKFNVGTVLKQDFLDGLCGALDGSGAGGVHDLLGSRRQADVLTAGAARVRARVCRLMRLYGSSGRS